MEFRLGEAGFDGASWRFFSFDLGFRASGLGCGVKIGGLGLEPLVN